MKETPPKKQKRIKMQKGKMIRYVKLCDVDAYKLLGFTEV